MFGDKCPPISATKSLTGHSLGATGVQEAIYCLLMMNNGFIAKSANIEELDPAFADMPIVRERDRRRRRSIRVLSQLLRLRRHQRDAGLPALRRVRSRMRPRGFESNDSRPDERQARPDHGRRQRSLDRLGHRQAARRAGRRARLHLSAADRSTSASGRSRNRVGSEFVIPCDVGLEPMPPTSPRSTPSSPSSAGAGATLDFVVHAIAFSDKNGAEGPLRRHDARQLQEDDGDLLLLLHRDREAGGQADAEAAARC